MVFSGVISSDEYSNLPVRRFNYKWGWRNRWNKSNNHSGFLGFEANGLTLDEDDDQPASVYHAHAGSELIEKPPMNRMVLNQYNSEMVYPWLTNYRLRFHKCPVAQVRKCLLNLFGGIHHKRSIGHDWFLDRCTSHEHEADTGVRCRFYLDLIAFTEND